MITYDDLLSEAQLFARAAAEEHMGDPDLYLAISALYRILADIVATQDMAKVLAPAA